MFFFRSQCAVAAALLLMSALPALAEDDCELAKRIADFAIVDCNYVWENKPPNNFLNYNIRVTGTGQNSDGFAQGIYDNIIGDCKRSHRDITHRVNRNDDLDTLSSGFNYLTGEASWLYGVSLNLHFTTGAWTEGEDNKACVASAIRKAVCSTVELEDFECYNQADMPTDEL